jgi:hypothetical protein
VTPGRLPRRARAAAAALLLLVLSACVRSVEGVPTAAAQPVLPSSAEELEPLIVPTVPSGLPRLPDAELSPRAGGKSLSDVASYAADPERERQVLAEYGYRFGWERFWGHDGGPITGVFVDQFRTREGAAAYAADLAANDAELYAGMLREDPPHLPGGCRLLRVPEPRGRLTGPGVFVWCGHGVFSVGVTAVADSVATASEEAHAVVLAQLDRLPPR